MLFLPGKMIFRGVCCPPYLSTVAGDPGVERVLIDSCYSPDFHQMAALKRGEVAHLAAASSIFKRGRGLQISEACASFLAKGHLVKRLSGSGSLSGQEAAAF